jgi:hypothetical protein
LEAEPYVGVHGGGDADVGVAEEFFDDDEFDALFEAQGSCRVADVVEPDAPEPGVAEFGAVSSGSNVACVRTTTLPDGSAPTSRRIALYAGSSSGSKCGTAQSSTATGLVRSTVARKSSPCRIPSGSSRSPSWNPTLPCGPLTQSARQWAANRLGIRLVNNNKGKHAEEDLLADNNNLIDPPRKRVASDNQGACGIASHNCAGQMDALGIEHN